MPSISINHRERFYNGQKLQSVFTPEDSEGNSAGGHVDITGCIGIEIDEVAGPEGKYKICVISYEDGKETFIPLHMVEYATALPDGQGEKK